MLSLSPPLSYKIIHDEPSAVKARDGSVGAKGPDEVDVYLAPEAAEETADRLTDEAVVARGAASVTFRTNLSDAPRRMSAMGGMRTLAGWGTC